MIKSILVICIIFISLLGSAGCSEKNRPGKTENGNSLEKPEEKTKVTFIELGSDRCVPCKMMQPIIEEIKQEYAGDVQVLYYDVWTEEGRPYGEQFKIRAIPTQIFLDGDGEEYFRHEGFFPRQELEKVLHMKL